jgi:hypothetical protein
VRKLIRIKKKVRKADIETLQVRLEESVFSNANALFFLLENWKEGKIIKVSELKNTFGKEGYETYKNKILELKDIEEYASQEFGVRTDNLKKFGKAYKVWLLSKTDIREEKATEMLNELNDEERYQITSDLYYFGKNEGNCYIIDSVWAFENQGKIKIFKKNDKTSSFEKKTDALIYTIETLIDSDATDEDNKENMPEIDIKAKLAQLMGAVN